MSELIPDAKVRYLVAQWPDDAPRGAVMAFCRTHGVSRSWFYKVRADAVANGVWEAMAVGSTMPRSSPNAVPAEMVKIVLDCRAELKDAGFDHGPLSVHAKLRRRGLTPPSRASLVRIFTRAGVVVAEPKKKPRSAYRRFVYPAPNCCWQIDGTQWTLEGGRVVVILQLIDDHSRLALASLVAPGETSEGSIAVVSTAIARHGVPQRFLSDNGAAFNPTRRGRRGKLVDALTARGIIMMTGKPGKPTTQGKIERIHQPLHTFLNAHPPARTMADLQALVDAFDQYCNVDREHQGLSRMTPQEAWDATPVASPPSLPATAATASALVDGTRQSAERIVHANGVVFFHSTRYQVGAIWAGTTVHLIHTTTTISFYDNRGTEILSYPKPAPGTDYVGPGRNKKSEVSTKP